MQADSRSAAVREIVVENSPVDLVLIHGNHEEEFCRADFELVRNRANIIVLHDIVSDVCEGVKKF
ncbi:MAG: hypothetical protein C4308_08205 [Chitinophagaceae bacterium]